MAIRANAFPEAGQWSEGERRAMDKFWPLLVRSLSPDVIFIADPEGSNMGAGSSIGPQFVGNSIVEMRLVDVLREVLAGGHLGFDEVQGVLRDVLPLEDVMSGRVSASLLSAFLIGQHMNRETDRELKAYCLAFDDELGSTPIADIRSLTHYGEPYDGTTLYFKSTLFVAAVRACYGESCLLHGVEWRPPKTHGREAIISGFYQADYEGALLMLMRRRGAHSGLVMKGEEGAVSMTTTLLPRDESNCLPVNYCSGFRSLNHPLAFEVDGVSREIFSVEVNAKDYGFKPTDTPRTYRSVLRNIELGLAALRGEKGPAYDRIVLNAGMADHLLGCDGAEDISTVLNRAREAIDSDVMSHPYPLP